MVPIFDLLLSINPNTLSSPIHCNAADPNAPAPKSHTLDETIFLLRLSIHCTFSTLLMQESILRRVNDKPNEIKKLNEEKLTFYIGTDPTAAGCHCHGD